MNLSHKSKTTLHFLITLLTTYLIADSSSRLNQYSMATMNNLCSAFLPEGCQGDSGGCRDPTTYDDDRFCRLSRKNATFDAVGRVVEGYFGGVAEEYLAGYNTTEDGTPIEPLIMTVKNYDNDPDKLITSKYNLTKESYGPLDYRKVSLQDVSAFYASLESFRITFSLKDSVPTPSRMSATESDGACYIWSVTVWYVDTNEAHLRVYVSGSITGRCKNPTNKESPSRLYFWMHVALLLLSAALGLTLAAEHVKNFRRAVHCRRIVRTDPTLFDRLPFMVQQSLRTNSVSLPSLPLRFYLRFLEWWDIHLCASSGLVAVSAVAHILGDNFVSSDGDRLLSGLCCATMWFGAGKYFRLSRHLYMLFLLVSLSAPEAFRILVGASPLFLAYGLLGTTVFGSSSTRFSSFTSSLTTLFSLMNGDIVLETLSVLKLNFPVLGPMYLASFFFLFTYFFLNVVLTVVEEALWMLNKEAGAHMVADRGRLTGASSRLGSRRISRILLRARSRMSTER
eukprot:CAMPEP_0182459704 /NCGR_PEP_ID=MMETSP1319-20130603/4772_1 /TAXON_ID=172717 /ORGANISM="Bolidomonas pacifica, Strain RCC208" /LENGTH=508 /DNA_ID=CAMNT_0024658675 /DNA_START=149 /DNA_END=1671 /DNA_ORIENTATION=+